MTERAPFGHNGADMILIAGLGNPGKKYEKTRHNLGFRVIDVLRERWGFPSYDGRFEAELSKGAVLRKQVLLSKPQSFMNLSGGSVAAEVGFYKIDARQDLWVIHDDLDLPLGHLRIRHGGSAGGHNGIKSVIERLGHQDFWRFRLGIGRPPDDRPIEDYVVAPFTAEEVPIAEEVVKRAADAIERALKEDLTKAMNLYNR